MLDSVEHYLKRLTEWIEYYFVCFQCSHSTRPCCREQHLRAGSDVFEEFICFRFGRGICQPLRNITNLENYAQLAKNLNSTNFFERLHLFEQNVKIDISDSTLDNGSYVLISVFVSMVITLYMFTIVLLCYIKRGWRLLNRATLVALPRTRTL